MAQGFGGFDTTYYGPTYTEDIEAIERGMQQGLQIGANIRQARAQNARQQADIEAQRQRDLATKMTLDKIDDSVKEGLILPAESKSDNLNDARMDFSNVLIDRLNQLKIARDNGDITNADYQKSVQVLNAQIPAFKSAEKVIYTGVEQFLDGLENGTLSNSISKKDFQFWSALARGEANVSYKVDKNGGIVLDGMWKDVDGVEHGISASLAEMDRLPFVSNRPETTAKQHLEADVKNILDTKEGNAMRRFDTELGKYVEDIQDFTDEEGYKPWFSQFAEESFEGYFNGLGRGDRRKALREYLMDSIDIGQRKELMDKLANKDLTSYGVDSLDTILQDKSITDINNFINTKLKQNWIGQAKEAVLKANQSIIKESNLSTQQAQLDLRKDIANTRKAEAQALKAQQELTNNTPKANSNELTEIYSTISGSNLAMPGSTFDRYKAAFEKSKFFIDQDEEGNYLIGKAGMKDQKKKRVIDPSRIGDVDFVMKELAALNNETWKQPITVK